MVGSLTGDHTAVVQCHVGMVFRSVEGHAPNLPPRLEERIVSEQPNNRERATPNHAPLMVNIQSMDRSARAAKLVALEPKLLEELAPIHDHSTEGRIVSDLHPCPRIVTPIHAQVKWNTISHQRFQKC